MKIKLLEFFGIRIPDADQRQLALSPKFGIENVLVCLYIHIEKNTHLGKKNCTVCREHSVFMENYSHRIIIILV